EPMTLTCSEEPTELKEVERIVAAGNAAGKAGSSDAKNGWRVIDVKETAVKRSPKAPFITSTLQQSASSRLGFAPSKTMGVAQRLYEAGHITYMRTDSTNLAGMAQKQIAAVVSKKFGEKYLSPRVFTAKSKNAQEAHEAIRPTNFSAESAGLTDEQKKLYRLIWQRTVASQMTDAETLRTKITANISDENSVATATEKIPDFSITGSRVIFAGWMEADDMANKEDTIVPAVKIGEPLKLVEIKTEEKQTEPPARYSEAGLIKELEKRGIGRPSTYASIIKTIEERGYVEKINKALIPTDTGDVVSTFLEENFTDYISDTFTAEMEDKLDDIANGKREYLETLEKFYKPFKKDVKSKEKIEKITNLGKADPSLKCPVCGAGMIIKLGKSGKFLSCEKFPDCVGARTITGEELEGPRETGELCPECATGKLIERDGKYGRFIACNNYPKCKFVKKDPELEKKASTGVACPVCKKGFMMEKRGRFGLFYSCSNYPDCKNAIKAKPTGNICEYPREKGPCGALMMEGTKTIPERCSDKMCPNHNPHKLEDSPAKK
ncbi:MAG: DNA topoisomerase, partial [Patescibacteria group bacterium]